MRGVWLDHASLFLEAYSIQDIQYRELKLPSINAILNATYSGNYCLRHMGFICTSIHILLRDYRSQPPCTLDSVKMNVLEALGLPDLR